MSTEIPYEFYLLNGAGQYLSPYGGFDEKPYIDEVEGSQELSFEFIRHNTYHGVFNSVIAPLRFVGKLGQAIKLAYSNNGVNSDIQLEIRMKNTTTQRFATLGVFEFQWSTYKETFDGIECELKQGGINSYIEANASKSYDLSYQKPEKVNVKIDGMYFYGYQQWITTNYVDNDESNAVFDNRYPPLAVSERHTEYSEITAQSYTGSFGNPVGDANSDKTLFDVIRRGEYIFSGFWYAYYKVDTGSVKLKLYAEVINGGTIVNTIVLWEDPGAAVTAGNDRLITVEFSGVGVTIEAGHRVRVFFGDRTASGSSDYSYAEQDKGFLNVDTRYQLPTVTIQGLRYYGALRQLIYRMTDNKYTLAPSDYMTGNWKEKDMIVRDIVLTSDTALREDTNQWLTLNFDDCIKDLQSRAAIGVGIVNNGVYISVLSEFYRKDLLIADIGEVANLVIEPTSDTIFNKLVLGYDYDDTKDGNAQFEFNIPVEWGSSIRQKFEDVDLKSSFIAGSFPITNTIADRFQKDTNDRVNSTDNVYLLHLKADQVFGEYIVERPDGISGGFPFDMGTFNWALSPGRAVYRLAPLIHSNLYKTGNKISITTRNRVLPTASSIPPAATLADLVQEYPESFDFTFAPLLYKPQYFTFDAKKVPNNFIYLLQQNKYGVLRFSFQGVVYEGFVVELTVKGREGAKFKLLSSPNNNI